VNDALNANINGLQVWFEHQGNPDAPPLVLIHGFPFTHEMWRPQTGIFSERFRVIDYDLRGLGQTGAGDGQYPFEFFVDDLISLLDHMKIRRAALCGLSMGGYIALRAIERNPERVAALILADTQARADSNEAKLKRAAAVRAIKENGVKPFAEGFLKTVFTPKSLVAKSECTLTIQRIIESNSSTGICGALIAMATRTDTVPSLSAIRVPTLILVGEQDILTPVSTSQEMHERICGSELRIIKDAAHLSNMENADEFNRQLVDFLSKTSL
jgi:pimeloyl-ACP methyl ester carboxylesterase